LPTLTPEEQLSHRIGDAITHFDVNCVDWAKENFLFGGAALDMRFSEELSSYRNQIKRSIGVEPLGKDFFSGFLCSCLGKKSLSLPKIRELLVRYELALFPKRQQRFLSLFKLTDEEERTIIDSTIAMNWRMGSTSSKKFLHELRLPVSLADSAMDGSRNIVELINPYRAPHPLLEFQETVKKKALYALDQLGRCLVVMPTGAGKTRTAIQTLGEFFASNHTEFNGLIWIADRDELCEQAAESFSALLPFIVHQPIPLWRYWGGRGIEISENDDGIFVEGIVVTSHQQMQRRLAKNDPIAEAIIDSAKAIVIDEAHRWLDWNEALISKVADINPNCKIVGLTATPYRRESRENSRLVDTYARSLITPYDEAMKTPQFTLEKLTHERILARRVDITPLDLGVNISSDSTPMIRMSEGLEMIKNLLEKGRKSVIVFTESVDQAKQLSICLNMEGIKSAYLDSETPPNSRRRAISRFRDGEILVLLNYMILTTGFDAPKIDSVFVLRKNNTEDLPVINQMIGRGLRGPLFGGTEDCYVVLR
jgi:DNA repair protein RadD